MSIAEKFGDKSERTNSVYTKWEKFKMAAHYLNFEFSDDFFVSSDYLDKYAAELPYPIHRPFTKSTGSDRDDKIGLIFEAKRTINKKSNWRHLIRPNEVKSVRDRLQSGESNYMTMSTNFYNYYCSNEQRGSDINCDYNPYYSRGFLDCIELNGGDYIIRPDGDNNLYLTDLVESPESNTIKLDLFNDVEDTSRNNNNIYSLEVNECNNDRILTLHRENDVKVMSIEDVDRIDTIWTKKFKFTPLDVTLNKYKNNQVGIIRGKRNGGFTVYDIETDHKVINCQNSKKSQLLEFISGNQIALMTMKDLQFVDARSCNDDIISPSVLSFQPKFDDCNTFTTFKVLDNTVYIGTRHYLVRSDLRSLRKYEFSSHMMKSPPTYLTLDGDCLCLVSQQRGESVLFYGQPVIGSIPMRLPQLSDSLHALRLSKDVYLREGLDERLQISTGGVKLIRQNGGNNDDAISLYMANCLGDVFRQDITCSHDDDDDKASSSSFNRNCIALNRLYDWIEQLSDLSNHRTMMMPVTGVVDISCARHALNKGLKHRNVDECEDELDDDNNRLAANRYLKRFTKKYRKKYLGEVGAGFAAVWDDDDEVSASDEDDDDEDKMPEVAPLEKVHSWIQSSTFDE